MVKYYRLRPRQIAPRQISKVVQIAGSRFLGTFFGSLNVMLLLLHAILAMFGSWQRTRHLQCASTNTKAIALRAECFAVTRLAKHFLESGETSGAECEGGPVRVYLLSILQSFIAQVCAVQRLQSVTRLASSTPVYRLHGATPRAFACESRLTFLQEAQVMQALCQGTPHAITCSIRLSSVAAPSY